MDGGGPSTITAPLAIEGGGGGERVMVAFLSPSGCVGHPRALWPRGASHFSCFAKKSNQKKATPGIRCFPAVLASGGRRRNRPNVALTRNQWAHAAPLGPPAAPLLGANPWGSVEPKLDRFAMKFTGTRMRASWLSRYLRTLPSFFKQASMLCEYAFRC